MFSFLGFIVWSVFCILGGIAGAGYVISHNKDAKKHIDEQFARAEADNNLID